MLKNSRLVLLVAVLGILVVILFWRVEKTGWDGKNDYRMAFLDDKRLLLVTISPERKMVNELLVEGSTELWVPGGRGWYRVEILKKMLTQEKKQEDLGKIVFYNFGLVADSVGLLKEVNDWDSAKELVGDIGVIGWLRFRMGEGQMLVRREKLAGDLTSNLTLDEVMPRDMADLVVLSEEMNISVINASGNDGLARFLTKRLEWAGAGVSTVENGEMLDVGCTIRWPKTRIVTKWWRRAANLIGCKIMESEYDDFVEITLGKKYDEMIKYSSYLR